MSYDRRTTDHSNAGTNITHNVNLSFEIGTSHICNGRTSRNRSSVKPNDGSGDCARNEDINGKPRGISHGNNHEMRSDYSGNVNRNIGNPDGKKPFE